MIEARGAKWVMGLSPVSCPFTESLIETCGEDVISSFECPKQVLISTDDLEYMVAANPKTVLALLDEVKRLREEVARLNKEADWLAESLDIITRFCAPEVINDLKYKSWREAARKAVEEEERHG